MWNISYKYKTYLWYNSSFHIRILKKTNACTAKLDYDGHCWLILESGEDQQVTYHTLPSAQNEPSLNQVSSIHVYAVLMQVANTVNLLLRQRCSTTTLVALSAATSWQYFCHTGAIKIQAN
jgi:hypothetical protein